MTASTSRPDSVTIPSKAPTVLVADDERPVRELLGEVFESAHYEVVLVENGKEAVDAFSQRRPDLVILDLMMPVMGGVEALERIKAIDPEAPVIFLSAVADPRQAVDCLKLGAADFLLKPVVVDQLLISADHARRNAFLDLETARQAKLIDHLQARLATAEKAQTHATDDSVAALRTLCGSVSHSLRNEFFSIGTIVRSLQEASTLSPRERRRYDAVLRSVRYGELILSRILNYLELGALPQESFGVGAIVGEAVDLLRLRAPARVRLRQALTAAARGAALRSNRDQLLLVLVELLTNAVRSQPEAGGTVTIGASIQGRSVVFSVSDEGPGIPEHVLAKLFEAPLQSGRSGHGIGLFLAAQAMRQLGGSINVQTSTTIGTTILVTLPLDGKGARTRNGD